jgi:small GTP-binding protein
VNLPLSGKELTFKVILIGDSGVGKTSLVFRYATSAFQTDLIPTMGVNIVAKELAIENKVVTLIIWDVGAQEVYPPVRKKYYSGAQVIGLVYDVTRLQTLQNIRGWLDDVTGYLGSYVPIILIGNKTDLPSRAVSNEQGQELAKEIHSAFVETSAKTGENVRSLFEKCAKACLT